GHAACGAVSAGRRWGEGAGGGGGEGGGGGGHAGKLGRQGHGISLWRCRLDAVDSTGDGSGHLSARNERRPDETNTNNDRSLEGDLLFVLHLVEFGGQLS